MKNTELHIGINLKPLTQVVFDNFHLEAYTNNWRKMHRMPLKRKLSKRVLFKTSNENLILFGTTGGGMPFSNKIDVLRGEEYKKINYGEIRHD